MKAIVLRFLSSRWFKLGCRLLLAGVFIVAGVGKIAKPAEFADATAGYQILPGGVVNLFAVTLPWVEVASGIALLSNKLVEYGATVVMGLNMMFIVSLSSALARHLHIECGCFNVCSTDSSVGWWLILRDAAFILLCIPLLLMTDEDRPLR